MGLYKCNITPRVYMKKQTPGKAPKPNVKVQLDRSHQMWPQQEVYKAEKTTHDHLCFTSCWSGLGKLISWDMCENQKTQKTKGRENSVKRPWKLVNVHASLILMCFDLLRRFWTLMLWVLCCFVLIALPCAAFSYYVSLQVQMFSLVVYISPPQYTNGHPWMESKKLSKLPDIILCPR